MSEELKAILEQIEALDELKQATLKSYIAKALDDDKHLDVAAKRAGAAEDDEMESALQAKKENRETGITSAKSRIFGKKAVEEAVKYVQDGHKIPRGYEMTANGRIVKKSPGPDTSNTGVGGDGPKYPPKVVKMKESLEGLEDIIEQIEALDEISKNTLGSYIKKAKGSMVGSAQVMGMDSKTTSQNTQDRAEQNLSKRGRGINTAVDRLTKESVEALVSSILDDGDASQAFNAAMAEKVTSSMDVMKVDIASRLTK